MKKNHTVVVSWQKEYLLLCYLYWVIESRHKNIQVSNIHFRIFLVAEHLGCWSDHFDRALPKLLENRRSGMIPYDCFELTKNANAGYKIFGLEVI